MPPFLMVDFSSLTLHFFVAKEMVLGAKISRHRHAHLREPFSLVTV